MAFDKKQKKVINIFVQVVIVAIVVIFLFYKFKEGEVSASLDYVEESIYNNSLLWCIVLLMMPLNWFFEAVKWQKLCLPLFNLKLSGALKGVMAGLAISFITPHGWGDYVGRIGVLNNSHRTELIGALFFGRMAQLFVTVIFGIFGLITYLEVWPYLYFWYILILFGVLLLLAFNKTIITFLKPFLFKIRKFFVIIKSYEARTVLEVLSYSFLRYLIFSGQFLIIILIFDVDLDWFIIFSGITWIFLVKSILPSFNFLSDLGIREVSAIMFFEYYLNDVSPIVAATLAIWIINILLPSIIGTLFVFSVKAIR